jgi:glycosyltransferase
MVKISIITPSFNSEKTIKKCILSIKNQSYSNIEHIIVDGGSTDNTLKIINDYKLENTLVISEKDKGLYDGWNKGFNIASGDIIGSVMSDDYLNDNNTFNKVVEKFIQNNCDILYGNMNFVLNNQIIRKWKAGNFKKYKYFFGWMPPTPTVFFRKKILDENKFYNLKYSIAADYEFFLRIFFQKNYNIYYLDEYLYSLKLGGTSTKSLKNIIKSNKECYEAWVDNKISKFPFWIILKPFSKIFQITSFNKYLNFYRKD